MELRCLTTPDRPRATPFARVRVVLLWLAIASVVAVLPAALSGPEPLAARLVAVVVALGLAVHWIVGFRRGGYRPSVEPLEAVALLVVLRVTPGNPFLPLFGMVFRSLYGGAPLAALRYAMWFGVMIAAHAHRGSAYLVADVARGVGLGLAPLLVQSLRRAFEAAEVSDLRLRATVRDLAELATQREHDATHDPLTGLANRNGLLVALEREIGSAGSGGAELTLLLIDLDHFKELNDTLGHHAGDRLLQEIPGRLRAAVPEADLVARLGGDEFAILLASAGDIEPVAERIRQEIEQPFSVHGLTLLVQASVGIARFPEHAGDVETLIQRAGIAMYSAKSRRVGHELYNASRDEHSRARIALIGELPDAIEESQIVVYYQPKVDLRTGAVAGAEALVRWDHPEHGLLGPGAFVGLAEKTGFMRPLTLYVLDDALAQCARWQAEGLDLTVAVNLSAPNLLDFGMPADVAALLRKWDVDPARLQLEITETIVAADPVRVTEIIAHLRELGVTLSLDDFGTGSSSLGFLRRLPIQELKVDKSFVIGMDEDEEAATIVRTIVELAQTLGLRSVAEGIETDAVRDRLTAFGCDHGQGFLLGRPMPADDLTALARPVPVVRRAAART